jgi:hypothetical protein
MTLVTFGLVSKAASGPELIPGIVMHGQSCSVLGKLPSVGAFASNIAASIHHLAGSIRPEAFL